MCDNLIRFSKISRERVADFHPRSQSNGKDYPKRLSYNMVFKYEARTTINTSWLGERGQMNEEPISARNSEERVSAFVDAT